MSTRGLMSLASRTLLSPGSGLQAPNFFSFLLHGVRPCPISPQTQESGLPGPCSSGPRSPGLKPSVLVPRNVNSLLTDQESDPQPPIAGGGAVPGVRTPHSPTQGCASPWGQEGRLGLPPAIADLDDSGGQRVHLALRCRARGLRLSPAGASTVATKGYGAPVVGGCDPQRGWEQTRPARLL